MLRLHLTLCQLVQSVSDVATGKKKGRRRVIRGDCVKEPQFKLNVHAKMDCRSFKWWHQSGLSMKVTATQPKLAKPEMECLGSPN